MTSDLYTCPVCARPTTPQRGLRSLCLPCTEDDIGVTLAEHRARINEVLGKGKTRKWNR